MRSLGPIRLASRRRFPRMMRIAGIGGIFAIALLCAYADAPRARTLEGMFPLIPATRGIGRDSSLFVSGDTIEIVARRDRLSGYRLGLSRYRFRAFPDFRVRRPVPLSLVLRPKPIELSRFSCAIHGADLGAGTASTLGGLGLFAGLWGEKTTGYLMGAGAILGALWGGTAGADDSRFRIRVGADPSAPAAGRIRPDPDDRRPWPPRAP
jgi:hypothetical protein